MKTEAKTTTTTTTMMMTADSFSRRATSSSELRRSVSSRLRAYKCLAHSLSNRFADRLADRFADLVLFSRKCQICRRQTMSIKRARATPTERSMAPLGSIRTDLSIASHTHTRTHTSAATDHLTKTTTLLTCIANEGPDYWHINKQWRLCSIGRKQSPINIRTSRLVFDHLLEPIQLSWLRLVRRRGVVADVSMAQVSLFHSLAGTQLSYRWQKLPLPI